MPIKITKACERCQQPAVFNYWQTTVDGWTELYLCLRCSEWGLERLLTLNPPNFKILKTALELFIPPFDYSQYQIT